MCGITGFIDKSARKEKKTIIEAMKKRIHHRGPDTNGTYVDDDIALGFVRLSIIDLEGGNQPIYNEDENYTLIYNGEIYNYQSLKSDLESLGHIFKTKTDSEVLLHGYEEYGPEFVKKLRGMFAFVIWNKEKKELFGARDHFGMKPFYYVNDDDLFIFGSEIKSFLEHPNFNKELNKEALKPYLTFQYSVLEETFFKGTYKLLPAHYFIYKNGKMDIHKYYEIEYNPIQKGYEEYMNEIHESVLESVEAHKVSDVPVGSFLSGGVDSSYITSCLRPDKSFSVGFENTGDDVTFNESIIAKELSKMLEIENHTKLVSADEFFDVIDKVQYHSDEPHANLSAVPLYFLSELTRKHVTVVLSGEGADELFGGYTAYGINKSSSKYRRFCPKPFRKAFGKVASKLPKFHGRNFLVQNGLDVEDYYIGQAFIFNDNEAKDILIGEYREGKNFKEITKPYFDKVKNLDDITKMEYLDMHLWLPHDILLKADKMTMAHSIELRVPLLDKELFSLAAKIPNEYKVKNNETKYIFREASAIALPKEWYMRKKKGFPVPFAKWIREDQFYKLIEKEFNADYTNQFFNQTKLNKMLIDHKKGKDNHGRKIWTVYAFLRWYNMYFIKEK